ncbi:MAG TPA: HAD-IA family hydrolase [Friedmanniella sp.]
MTTDQRALGLLFDMDGTLLDSTPLVEQIWTAFAGRHGLAPGDVIAFAHGRPTRVTVAHFLASSDVDDEVERIATAEAGETRGIVALPGSRAYLDALEPDRWAVVTSATRAVAAIRMQAAGLPLPRVLVTSEDVVDGKPSPEGYLQAARALNRDPAACVVFEDAGPGIMAGRNAGAEVVVVGAYRGDAAEGLARIADFRDLAGADGRVRSGSAVTPR